MGSASERHENVRKGIYILPNLFTTGSLFAGFYSLVSTLGGDYRTAAIWILAAAIFDGLDGKVARATGTTSKFGVEYDSLADLVSFGVAPGFLMYAWALRPFGRIGWLAGFLFVACAALRLARFNVQVETVESTRFVGLPSPAAASMACSTVLLFYSMGWPSTYKKLAILVLIYLVAFLMVSNVRYYSFKDPELIKKQPFAILVGMILLFVIIAAAPIPMLFFLFLIYTLSGPVGYIVSAPRHRREKRNSTQVRGGEGSTVPSNPDSVS